MIVKEKDIMWLKEHLAAHELNDEDKKSTDDIVRTFRALWVVVKAARGLVDKTKVVYLPGSRKGQLLAAITALGELDKQSDGN